MSEECAESEGEGSEEQDSNDYGPSGVSTSEVPQEGPVGQGNPEHEIEDLDEEELSLLENMVHEEGKAYDEHHQYLSHKHLQNRISKYMERHKVEPTTQKEKANRKQELKSAEPILELLMEMLNHKEVEALKATKPDMIDSGWPYKAADANGYIRAVQEIKTIIHKE